MVKAKMEDLPKIKEPPGITSTTSTTSSDQKVSKKTWTSGKLWFRRTVPIRQKKTNLGSS